MEKNALTLRKETPGLLRGTEGELTIALQADRLSEEGVNWLPMIKGQQFWQLFSAYQPGPSMLDSSLIFQAVNMVK